jgi:cytochrome c-type biogenesis protein
MLQDLFVSLTAAVNGSPAVAVGASLAWGILSILLSPCHLASIPLIVGFIGGQGPLPPRRAFHMATAFAVGMLITIAAIGVITAAAGRLAGDIGPAGNYLVAGVFFLVGLHLLDVIPLPGSGPGQAKTRGRGVVAAFVLGLVFGVALGPCTFAFMAPMLAVTFQVAHDSLFFGAMLLLAYGVGHCAVIVLAGSSTELVQRYLAWSERSRGTVILRRVCGVRVLIAGVYMIYTAP